MSTINFNAHHAPLGAFASFTLGFRGAKGGFGQSLGQPANEKVYIGVESQPDVFEMLPFWDGAEAVSDEEDPAQRFLAGGADVPEWRRHVRSVTLRPLGESALTREFGLGSDTFSANDWGFSIYSPVRRAAEPGVAGDDELKWAYAPVVWCELVVDNSTGTQPRRAFFGYAGSDPYIGMRRLDSVSQGQFVGIGQGRHVAIVSRDESVQSALAFGLQDVLGEGDPQNYDFGLGKIGVLVGTAAPGEVRRFKFAVCFHQDGIVTANQEMRFLYASLFERVEDVAQWALDNFDRGREAALEADALVENSNLSSDRKWQLCHAVRSYYGSTQMLEFEGKPVWCVNEGEYRMMNTFDLAVDHVFWEMRQNPWTVRNVLDRYIDRYSYEDSMGLSFTHDHGVANVWSREGYSSYERYGLTGCFSHMTHEQLVNWLLCASVYVHGTGDQVWLERRWPVFEQCFASLLARDADEPSERRGIMQRDSDRCCGGAEITTYDSLDVSLGQARNNTYLGIKTWAAYLALEKLFAERGDSAKAEQARDQASRGARTIVSQVAQDGTIPAVLEENVPARIIPVIEGLAFPMFTGREDVLASDGPFAELLDALRTHHKAVLREGVCLFPNGGWKLSSTADNSWLSKIYLCQWVARSILGISGDTDAVADAAHVSWLLDPSNAYWSWSDQMVAGKAGGSKYYPRGVTSCLWLGE